MKRRTFLSSIAGGCALFAAGCSALQDNGVIDLWIDNSRTERMTARVAFIRPEVSDRSEAIAYGENFELAPGETVSQGAVAPNQPYRIELELDGEDPGDTFISHHHHYRPFGKDHIDLRIRVNIRQNGVEFFDTF